VLPDDLFDVLCHVSLSVKVWGHAGQEAGELRVDVVDVDGLTLDKGFKHTHSLLQDATYESL